MSDWVHLGKQRHVRASAVIAVAPADHLTANQIIGRYAITDDPVFMPAAELLLCDGRLVAAYVSVNTIIKHLRESGEVQS